MRPGSKGLSVLAIVLLALRASAEPPDLTGRWMLVVENAGPSAGAAPARIPATASSGWGREITITREGARLTIERHQFAENDMQPPMRYVYALGQPESRNVVNMGRGPQELVARAELKGEALVIASRHAPGTDLAAEVTYVFSIERSGELVVDTTRAARSAVVTTKARYRRQPPPSPVPAR
jgi:hypothetical protein